MVSGLTSFICQFLLSLLCTLGSMPAHKRVAFIYLQKYSSSSGLGIGSSIMHSHCPSGKALIIPGNDRFPPSLASIWRLSNIDSLFRNSFCHMPMWTTRVMHGPTASLPLLGSKLSSTGSRLTCTREIKKVRVLQMRDLKSSTTSHSMQSKYP